MAQHLLQQTNGNLYALNLVSRVGALSGSDQVRLLDNDVTLSDLGGLRLGPDGNWIDPSGIGRDAHAAAAPLSGAIWDCFVELFQDGLVRRGAIGHQLDTRGWNKARVTSALAELHAAAGAALQRSMPSLMLRYVTRATSLDWRWHDASSALWQMILTFTPWLPASANL